MFNYFFDEYKENIYKKARYKPKWWEFLMAMLLVAIFVGFVFSVELKLEMIVSEILFLLLTSLVVIAAIYYNQRAKANKKIDEKAEKDAIEDTSREKNKKSYEEKYIDSLRNKLKEWNLYTNKGIEWLIDCCKEERGERKKDFAPLRAIGAFVIGTILAPSVIELVMKIGTFWDVILFITILSAILIMAAGVILCVQPIVFLIIFPNKNVLAHFEKDLKYIRSKM